MSPGDIVLIRFPQADLKSGKLRPALVVAVAPGRHPDLILALISSQVHQAVPSFDELIKPTDPDYKSSKLKSESIVRLARLATVESAVIRARLGRISQARLIAIKNRLSDWLQD